ncbi:MAG: hypothetical protein NVV73_22195 [Cellvibrionaceae bacterium]|nr:hypothetical protein [Cellvibrionaceae bacterium]
MPVKTLPFALKPLGPLALSLALLAGCGATTPTKDAAAGKSKEGYENLEDLYIVDCLLPGQVRRLGTMQYLSPRRAVRTTTADCRIRGGEYVEYDRADYRSALKVWLPQAEQGDAEAQNYVGEIFEKRSRPGARLCFRCELVHQGSQSGIFTGANQFGLFI